MSAERDVNRIVRSWLRTDEYDSADAVLGIVLSRLDTTPQRRSWWPARRSTRMNLSMKAAIAAAAVLVVALVSLRFLPASSVGPTVPTLVPTPPAMLSGSLEPGTYRLTAGAAPMTVTIATPGWSYQENAYVGKGDDPFEGSGVSMAVWTVSHIYSDSCRWNGTLQETRTPRAIVTALDSQVGHDTVGPTVAVLGGVPATRFEFSVPATFDITTCYQSFMRLWPDAGPNENYGLPIFPGQTSTVWVVDHGDAATLIIGLRTTKSTATDVAELDAIIDSVDFLP